MGNETACSPVEPLPVWNWSRQSVQGSRLPRQRQMLRRPYGSARPFLQSLLIEAVPQSLLPRQHANAAEPQPRAPATSCPVHALPLRVPVNLFSSWSSASKTVRNQVQAIAPRQGQDRRRRQLPFSALHLAGRVHSTPVLSNSWRRLRESRTIVSKRTLALALSAPSAAPTPPAPPRQQ